MILPAMGKLGLRISWCRLLNLGNNLSKAQYMIILKMTSIFNTRYAFLRTIWVALSVAHLFLLPVEATQVSDFGLSFDGSKIASAPKLFNSEIPEFTIAGWFKVTGSSTGGLDRRTFFLHRADHNDVFMGYSNSGTLYIRMINNLLEVNYPWAYGDVLHLAALYDGVDLILYVNGVNIGQGQVQPLLGIVDWNESYSGTYIGGSGDGTRNIV